jgi:hypothetical protein
VDCCRAGVAGPLDAVSRRRRAPGTGPAVAPERSPAAAPAPRTPTAIQAVIGVHSHAHSKALM